MLNSNIGVFHFLILGFILFIAGLWGIIISKNPAKMFFSIIIILNAVCINFVGISQFCDGIKLEGSVFYIFIAAISLIYSVIFVFLIINLNNLNKEDNKGK